MKKKKREGIKLLGLSIRPSKVLLLAQPGNLRITMLLIYCNNQVKAQTQL